MTAPSRLTDPKPCHLLVAALCAVYFSGYFARLNYATVIAEIVAAEGILKSSAALCTTACFITYGVGQLLSGFLGDRVSPKLLIFSGLGASALFNFLMPFCPGIGFMVVLWGLNGLAQALLWPPMMRLMTAYFDPVWVERGCVRTSIASSSATVLLYLCAPPILRLGGWRAVFRVSAFLAAATAVLWLLFMNAFEKKHGSAPTGPLPAAQDGKKAPAKFSMKTMIFGEGLLFVMLAIVLQGILRDGVTTWLPSYLIEVFSLETGSSILSSVVIPLFSIFSFPVCAFLHRRFFRNEAIFSAGLFGFGLILSLAMAALYTASAPASALLAALLTAAMHGINLMLICNLPARFAASGKVSLLTGMLNACTYVGSALSTYVFALIAQSAGWRATVVCWAGVCLCGAAACLIAARRCRSLLQGPPED